MVPGLIAHRACRLNSMAARWPALPATRWLRRCWRKAQRWWGAATSCTGHAAFFPAASKSPPAWSMSGWARCARPTRVPPISWRVTVCTRSAATAGPAWSSTSPPALKNSPPFCRPGFITRRSCGRTGICSSPPSGAWRGLASRPMQATRSVTTRSRSTPKCW